MREVVPIWKVSRRGQGDFRSLRTGAVESFTHPRLLVWCRLHPAQGLVEALVDTGAQWSVLPHDFYRQHEDQIEFFTPVTEPPGQAAEMAQCRTLAGGVFPCRVGRVSLEISSHRSHPTQLKVFAYFLDPIPSQTRGIRPLIGLGGGALESFSQLRW